MLANNCRAAAVSASALLPIAVRTGLYSGAAGSSDRNADDVLGTLGSSDIFITCLTALTYLIVAMVIIDGINNGAMRIFRYKQNRLQQLKGFCAVVEAGSVSKAAGRL